MKRAGFALATALASTALTLLPAPAHALTLVYSNDVLGEIEPCGCRTNPLGGMDRKAELLRTLREKDPSLLQLDGGDLLFSTVPIPEALAPQSEVQAGYVLKAMKAMGHDAAVPGEKDFALGLKTFEKLTRKSGVQFLAANLARRNGKTFLKPYSIFSKAGKNGKPVKVAVLGLVGSSLSWPKELKAASPADSARKLVPELRTKADVVIVLSHLGYEGDVSLAKAVPGIDLIVGSHTQSFLQTPKRVGKTVIYQSSFRNQYVGVLPLDPPFKGDGHELIGLDTAYLKPNLITPMIQESRAAINKLNEAEAASSQLAALPGPGNGAPKFQTFVRCAECHMKQFDFWRKTPHANALQVLVKVDRAKNMDCFRCHTVGFNDKEGFSNVNQLAERRLASDSDLEAEAHPLKSAKRDFLPFNEVAAYLKSVHEAKTLNDTVKLTRVDAAPMSVKRSISSVKNVWASVQCENCHQPGKDHPFSGSYTKTVENSTCLNCHREDQAPGWYKAGQPDWKTIEAKRKLISCPAGELADEGN